jgi:hypothetical protein
MAKIKGYIWEPAECNKKFFFVCFHFCDRVSLCNSSWPWTYDSPASVSWATDYVPPWAAKIEIFHMRKIYIHKVINANFQLQPKNTVFVCYFTCLIFVNWTRKIIKFV